MDQGAMTDTVKVQAEISEELFSALKELAAKRGVTANTVLQQAIATEKLLADNIGADDKVLIAKPDKSMRQVIFEKLK